MNKSILMGRLTRDPELRYTANNTECTSFTIAVDRRFKQEGQPTADFIPVIAWGKLAELVNNYFKKGSRILLTGRIQTRNWDDAEGKKRYSTEVIAEEISFVDTKREQQAPQYMQDPGQSPQDGYFPIDDDDIPF